MNARSKPKTKAAKMQPVEVDDLIPPLF